MMRTQISLVATLFFCLVQLAGASENPSGHLEQRLIDQGLVNIHSLASDILVELKYSSPDNFLGRDMYGDLTSCYLQPKAAKMLKEAQRLLKRTHPELTLLVYDGARPRSVQRNMWALVVNTPSQGYVANPERGSVHNYGSAIDLTLATQAGTPLDMGTPYDYFGKLAQPRFEDDFLAQQALTKEQVQNRRLLRRVMTTAGFQSISNEWWHFNAVPVKIARSTYTIIE